MNHSYSEYETLAIAYLTGQATPEELAKYRSLYSTDAGFREIVDDVETWLAPLNEAVLDQAPPEGLLGDIMREIEQDGIQQTLAKPVEHIPSTQYSRAANNSSSRKWRALAMISSIIAILAVGSHFITLPKTMETTSPETQTLLALLSDQSQPELMAIIYNPKTGKVVARLSNIVVPEDGDLQLWLIREGEISPVSLGVLDKVDELGRVELLTPLTLQTGSDTLAISLEALGGSKSTAPEGPVLYTGALSEL
jgi:anti-sigma-K factor RskA